MNKDTKLLLGCIGASVLSYNAIKCGYNYFSSRSSSEYIPIGVVSGLYIYPAKSLKGKNVRVEHGEMKDRGFIVIDGETGTFYTGRQKPGMVLIDAEVKDGYITLTLPDGKKAIKKVSEVLEKKDLRQAFLFQKSRTDGYDCGDEISELLSGYFGEKNVRLLMHVDGLYTERTCVTEQNWWQNTEVPKRTDKVAYPDLAPYMIMTTSSVEELNKRLDVPVSIRHFRPEIIIDKCEAFDEDKWESLKIGDVELECFRPCDRCVFTTVNPDTGIMDKTNQPLKTLREFRLAPDGVMRKTYKDSPLLGVFAGSVKKGYIHEGQVVYAKYKKNVF